jgi:hypothetical protein
MISADRFLVSKGLDESGWLEIREHGISATEVANASTPAGYKKVVEARLYGSSFQDNAYMAFGREQEQPIAMWLKDEFGVMPNDWSICHEVNRHHTATPDGLSLDHLLISEIKTTGTDFDGKVPIAYMRQMQWQMYVTDTGACVFAWMLRMESEQGFVPAWFEPKVMRVKRDNEHIASLIVTADKLWTEIQHDRNKNG